MKKHLLTFTIIAVALFFQQCKQVNNNQTKVESQETTALGVAGGTEKQDGIREAQEMEFEMTKDVALGYVPKDRLIAAYEKMVDDRKNGSNGPSSALALTWAERGPNTDVIGPSNGNTRGNQVAADGVTSGRMRAIWVDLTDVTNRTVWIGGISGGLWKTTDITSAAASSWTLVNDFFGNLAISSICQDPSNTNIMYFGTGEKSFNGDAVRGGGIWKSTNNGGTWALLPSTSAFNNISKILCDGAGNVYVTSMGLFGANGVLRSTDGGTSWTTITPAGLTSFATEMKLSNTGRLHVVCGYRLQGGTSGYRFTDNPSTVTSATWTAPTTTFITDYNTELAVAGNNLYALPCISNYTTPQIYKSVDGGVNWAATTTSPPSPTTPGSATSINTGQGWYDLAIAIDPANSNNVVAGGLNTYRTTDGGATWTQIAQWFGTGLNYVHADHHSLQWNGTQVLFLTDGGLFYSNNNGASFVDRNDGLRLKQFYSCAVHPSSINYIIAGAQDNGTHQLSNPGLAGSVEVIGGDGGFTHIDQNEPQYQFSAFTGASYIRSTNSGANWASVSSPGGGQFINPSDYDDAGNRMYSGYNAGQYLRWNNPQTGTSYSAVTVPSFNSSSVLHVLVSPYTPNRVFFGTAGGRIVRVDNAHGAAPTATNITGAGMSTSTVSCIATGTDDNNLIATFSNYGAQHIWASTNGGTAWTNISGNIPDIPVRWAMFYPESNTKALVATEMGVYETDLINGASTAWVLNATFPTVKTNMLQYRKSDGTIIAATHGRGIWSAIIPFTNPYVRFELNYDTQQETTVASTATCRNYRDYIINMLIDQAPTGNATITLNLAGGATATQGVDFDFTTNGNFAAPSNIVSFASGATTPQPITVRIYNDAEVELDEQFTLNYTISGATNAVAAPSSGSYTFNIENNDLAPVSGTNAVATILNTSNTEYIANNGNYNFYNGTTIISSISNASANLGCVSSNVFEAGNTWQAFNAGLRSQKVVEIIPTANSGASYTVGLYFTAAELAGLTPANLKIAKTNAATMAAANGSNTIIAPTVFSAFGTGYLFTATFTGFSKFFLTDQNVALPVTLISFSGTLNGQKHSKLQWRVTDQYSLKNFEVQRSYDGAQFTTAGNVDALQNSSTIKDYGFTDPLLAKPVNYYRLKMIDDNGRFKFSDIIKIENNIPLVFVQLLKNPVSDNISLLINNTRKEKITVALINTSGQMVSKWDIGKADGSVSLPFQNTVAKGMYILQIIRADKAESFKITKL